MQNFLSSMEVESGSSLLAMKVTKWCVKIFLDYVVFPKSVLFILGLIFSYKLVEKVFFNILITHLADAWKNPDMRKAAIVVNLQEGICAVLQIFFAFVADAYSGLLKMVVCSTTLCIIGLSLIRFAAGNSYEFLDLRVFYPALVLMTLSQAALIITLQSFLGDQLVESDQRPATPEEEERAKKRSKLENEERAQKCSKSEKEETAQKNSRLDEEKRADEEERARKRSKFWWTAVSFLAAIFALFGPLKDDSFRNLSMILAIVMGATFLWFLLGIKSYRSVPPTNSPLSDVVFVIHSAIVKRNVEYPQNPEQRGEISPHVSWLRWLDRAMIKQGVTVEQVQGVKVLFKMLPMWATFLTFSLVAASGSTFFLGEATSITDDTFPILLLTNLQRLTEFMVTEIADYVLEKLGEEKKEKIQRMMLARIGIGMVCCVLCCIAAWANAVHRLHLVSNDEDPKDSMSVYRLTPQYLLLAFMTGLSADGLANFFNFQVSRSMSKYGPPFGECVMGVGKFLSIVFILILSRWLEWFKDEPNPGRLDKYYVMLAILSSLNIILYCLVARWYGYDTFLLGDATDIEMGQIVPITDSSLGGNLTENSHSEQNGDNRLPLLLNSSSSSTTFLADNNRLDDHEAETHSTDQVSLLASESTMNGSSHPTSIEMGISGQANLQVDSVVPLVSRSHSSKGQYNSHRISPMSEKSSSGDNLTENTNSEQSQTHQEVPEQVQEITLLSSSTVQQADDRGGDHEADTLKNDDFDSMDRVSLLASDSTMNGPSDALARGVATTFLRLPSKGVRMRSHSMRLKNQ